jgi:hypothetical protein
MRPTHRVIRFGAGLVAMTALWLCSAAAGAAVPHPPQDEIRKQVEEILARPEFAPPKETSLNWVEKIFLWIGQRITEFVIWLASLQATAPVLFWLLVSMAILAVLFLMTYAGRKVRRILYLGARPGGKDSEQQKRARLSQLYREEAQKWAARNNFTEAIRYLFLSLVYHFDEAGRVNFQQAYTNREYLALFAERPRVRTELRVFVDTLDDHWYGERPTDQARYEECLALYEDLSR